MHFGDPVHCRVVELRAGLAASAALEQPHLVAVERCPGRELPGDRQVRVDRRHVRDRGLLQVEHRHVLAAVRDLEHTVLEQKRLIALAA